MASETLFEKLTLFIDILRFIFHDQKFAILCIFFVIPEYVRNPSNFPYLLTEENFSLIFLASSTFGYEISVVVSIWSYLSASLINRLSIEINFSEIVLQ